MDVPPLTEGIAPGTATDPDVGSDEAATVTVDGTDVTVPAGSTLLDAVDAVETDGYVPALCHYGRQDIGPRSECRTCMVETESDGVVPACSFPAEDGAVVDTDAGEAAEARDVNLDLVLSDHNLRCTTCGKNGRCELQDASIDQGVEEPRYGVLDDRDQYEPLDDSSSFIQIDRNKCILCNRCVEACNDVQVEGVLRMEGTGNDTRIGFQNGAETMEDSTCVSCGHCVTVCPTGSLVEKGIENATTIPIPGFNQKNSIGKTYENTDSTGSSGTVGRSDNQMTPQKRDQRTLESEEAPPESDGPDVVDPASEVWDDERRDWP
ncbi:NADH:ubiquinone oxidoreductase, subunit G, iron- sulfur binding protein [Candidatus Halobonum tyrrellensis G22]|uniref:NADH:ubiquinone oxidoreductase, subunit G, iron-sulfur binding protein n=1 Tax=Candidatus Halobonum tyrrellensis G22 TaxID=1324957 RepID=V4HDI8_9EURY|nr:NADH:ubiquinone oxidoreductase, subunit G, iron- sulfur binding protein [Candidatus Halobonum tyrrellensis G22]